MANSIFKSAITGTDGAVDSGYLAMFAIMAAVFLAIPFMCVFTAIAMVLDPAHQFAVQALGIGIGSVCGGFGVAIGAVGGFRMGDKPRAATPGTVTTIAKETIVTEAAAGPDEPMERGTPDKPLHVAVKVPRRAAKGQGK